MFNHSIKTIIALLMHKKCGFKINKNKHSYNKHSYNKHSYNKHSWKRRLKKFDGQTNIDKYIESGCRINITEYYIKLELWFITYLTSCITEAYRVWNQPDNSNIPKLTF